MIYTDSHKLWVDMGRPKSFNKLCSYCGNPTKVIDPVEGACHACRTKLAAAFRTYLKNQLHPELANKPKNQNRKGCTYKRKPETASVNNPNEKYVKRPLTALEKSAREVEQYNKAHGTALSYGKYFELKACGRL